MSDPSPHNHIMSSDIPVGSYNNQDNICNLEGLVLLLAKKLGVEVETSHRYFTETDANGLTMSVKTETMYRIKEV